MIVQWGIKGLALANDEAAREILDSCEGLICNWWRDVGEIYPNEVRERLVEANLERHVNHFTSTDPASGRPFSELTPFISLSAGVVSRDTALMTNRVHRARR